MHEEFEVGERVIVHVPDGDSRYDTDIFNAGWDEDMNDYEGVTAEIIRIGEIHHGRNTYCVRFPEEDTWWWDPCFMDHLDDRTQVSVSDEDFDAVLN